MCLRLSFFRPEQRSKRADRDLHGKRRDRGFWRTGWSGRGGYGIYLCRQEYKGAGRNSVLCNWRIWTADFSGGSDHPYTEEEKAQDPKKENTGLFFFRGEPGGKTAICSAGGGFVYVGAMQDSFPHALELSKNGYNAFALIYRPGAQTACEDLARAIAFLHNHAEELEIDMTDYSLWGGSAGARMAAWLGSYGTQSFGEQEYPRPAAVIMQYTGLSEVTGNEPPTYNCVGTRDGIASYRIMEDRISRIKEQGTDAEIQVFEGLPHGFGLGEGTTAEGWINRAIAFWERQM